MRDFGLIVWLALASAFILEIRSAVGQYDKIFNGRRTSIFTHGEKRRNRDKTPMHKALFTQRGYIQFLRWELPVPEIEEFTFCLWVKSVNLTYSHSIFSYSMNEEKRLARSWIAPFGRSIHFEIGGLELIAHPANLNEHRWYHICESWENQMGHYALWINGKQEAEGYADQLVGHVIPSGGDIVVGQEYTDFDKGLEEGIEGAVLGFNLLLASAFDRPKNFYASIDQNEASLASILSLGQRVPLGLEFNGRIARPTRLEPSLEFSSGYKLRRSDENGVRFLPAPITKIVNERREGMFDSTLKEYLNNQEPFGRSLSRRGIISLKSAQQSRRDVSSLSDEELRAKRSQNRTMRSVESQRGRTEPLGLQLVSLTYGHCEIGRGSPFIGGSKMLISWTRTPVKVFGGAILKNARNNCGDF